MAMLNSKAALCVQLVDVYVSKNIRSQILIWSSSTHEPSDPLLRVVFMITASVDLIVLTVLENQGNKSCIKQIE